MVVDMKAKFLIVVLAALVLATGTVWAQKGHRERSMEQKEISTEQVARRMTDRMKENLSLSDEQVKTGLPYLPGTGSSHEGALGRTPGDG